MKNDNEKYENFLNVEEDPRTYSYTLKGLIVNIVQKNNMVNLSITGSTNEALSKETFYDLSINSNLAPLFEINDTFLLASGGGMIRITTDGVLRLYPWTNLESGLGIRYSTTYISN